MSERPENFIQAEDESETTLVTPRFDAEEARHAHPVVPLAEARTHAAYAGRRAPRVRRSWAPVLFVVALVAVAAAAGTFATNFLHRPQPTPAAQVPAATLPPSETAEAAPAQAEPPAPAPAAHEETRAKAAPRAAHARRAEDSGALAASEDERGDAEDLRDEDEGRRDKGHGKRRGHGGDEGDKEIRRALKDAAKKKVPRLVDVLTSP